MKISLSLAFLMCFCMNSLVNTVMCERGGRVRRQNTPGDALIDAVFQVPIQTLSAVGTLVKSTRPVVMAVRQRIIQSLTPREGQPQRFSFPGYGSQQQANNRISSVPVFNNQYKPSTNYNNRYQANTVNKKLYQLQNRLPNGSFNKLYQQPNQNSSHRFSPRNNK